LNLVCKKTKTSDSLEDIGEACSISPQEVLTLLSEKASVTEADLLSILKMRSDGRTLQEISKRFGVSQRVLAEFLSDTELSDRSRAAILEYAQSGKSALQISRLMNLKRSDVTEVLAGSRSEDLTQEASSEEEVELPQKSLPRTRAQRRSKEKPNKLMPSPKKHVKLDEQAAKQLKQAEALERKASRQFHKGSFSTAEANQLRSIEIRQDILGADDSSLGTSYNVLSCIQGYSGDFDKAIKTGEKALEICKLYPDHPNLLHCFKDLGALLYNAGDYEGAAIYELEGLIKQQQSEEPDQLGIADSCLRLANVYAKRNDFAQAEKFYASCLEIYQDALDPENPILAKTFSQVGSFYFDAGHYDEALEFYGNALELRLSFLDPNDALLFDTYLQIGKTYYELGALKEAEESLTACLVAVKAQESPVEFDYLGLCKCLGSVHLDLSNLHKAQEFLSICVELDPQNVITINKLGDVYRDLGDRKMAEQTYLQALHLLESLATFDHLTAMTLWGLGVLYRLTGKKGNAENCFLKCVEGLESIDSNTSLKVSCYRALGSLYREMGMPRKALAYYSKLPETWRAVSE